MDSASTVIIAGTATTYVVVPVKAFGAAKARLADVLTPAERVHLARTMATQVVAAAAPLPVAVVCDDDEVATWAESVGARVLWTPGLGLNGAVTAAVATLGSERSSVAAPIGRVIVAHADLPAADDLARVDTGDGVCLVPDRRGDGTNVCAVPAGVGFQFAYGPKSFVRHQIEAERLGLAVTVIDDLLLGWDIDQADDLRPPAGVTSPAWLPVPA